MGRTARLDAADKSHEGLVAFAVRVAAGGDGARSSQLLSCQGLMLRMIPPAAKHAGMLQLI